MCCAHSNADGNELTIRLAELTQELTQQVAELDHMLARLSDFETTWSETRAAARSQAPPEIVQRIETLLNEIKRARSEVETRRTEALRLQNRVTAQDARASQALAAIRARRDETIDRRSGKGQPADLGRSVDCAGAREPGARHEAVAAVAG
jgi:hypothetical protein